LLASLLSVFVPSPARAGVVLTGGGLTLVEEGGVIAPGNLAAGKTAFAKDVLPGYAVHAIAHANDQNFGNSFSWIGNSLNSFVGIDLGATPVYVSSIAFGRDNNGGFSDRTLGVYTLQYTTVPNPGASTPDASWTTIGTLDYQSVGGSLFASPSRRHRFNFTQVSATGIRLIVPGSGIGSGACIDELELYHTPETLVVTTTADEADSPAGANRSLREAVRDLLPGGTVRFAPELSGQTLTLTAGEEIVLDKNLTIDASNLPGGITVDGGVGSNRHFAIPAGSTVTLNRLTLTGGNGAGSIENQQGGAIYNAGTLSLIACTVTQNSASSGGGIFSLGVLDITGSTLSGNSSHVLGGGLAIVSGNTTAVSRSTISGNSAGTSGGGIFVFDDSFTATQCTIAGNSAVFGGGIVFSGGSTAALSHCTIAGNSATVGSGIRNYFGSTCTAENTIVAGNISSVQIDGFVGTTNCVTSGDPLLAPLGNNGGPTLTMLPLTGSPAMDGALGSSVATDQRGVAVSGVPEIGATEAGCRVTTVADELDTPAGSQLSLREAIRDAQPGALIDFAAALSGQTVLLTQGSQLSIGKALAIDAGKLPAGLSLDGGGVTRILSKSGTQLVSLSGLWLKNGNAGSGMGGGIQTTGELSLTDCTVSNCGAASGGAIHSSRGSLTLTRCTLTSNSAAGQGGAVWIDIGTGNLVHSTVAGNSAGSLGAGIILTPGQSGTLDLQHSIVAGNSGSSNIFTHAGHNLFTASSLTSGDPMLAPLGDYGGPTPTMPPLPGSPAINGAPGSTATRDQRGFPVFQAPDLGAAEGTTVVTTTADEFDTPTGSGISLREAVRDTPSGGRIAFAPALSGQTATVGTQIVLNKNVAIDAGTLAAGMTLHGGDLTRILDIPVATTVSLSGLVLRNGNAFSGDGGAIRNAGNLTISRCTLTGNSGYFGGAVFNSGTLTASQCTLASNSALQAGGGVFGNQGTTALTHCTITANAASAGGAVGFAGATALISNSILCGNTTPNVWITNPGGFVSSGGNVLHSGDGIAAFKHPSDVLTAAPLLSPLGNFGGGTPTIALLAGSPARNAAAGSLATSDQRGVAIVGTADSGAYEAGASGINYESFIWESLPTAGNGLITDPLHAGTHDFDGDGQTNADEWAALTHPADGASFFAAAIAISGADAVVTFPSAAGRTYTLQTSADLSPGSWTSLGLPAPLAGDGGIKQFTVPALDARRFFRVTVAP
jgi:hypothetical protein